MWTALVRQIAMFALTRRGKGVLIFVGVILLCFVTAILLDLHLYLTAYFTGALTAAVIIWRAIVYSPIEQSIANVFASKRKKRYAALQRLRFGEKSLTKRSRQWPVQQGRRAIARLALPRQGFPKHAIGLTLGAPSRKPNRQV